MNRLYPFIDVAVNGGPVSGGFYKRLVSATIHDAPGQDADRVDLKFDDEGNTIAIPQKGAGIEVKFGFRGAGGFKMGTFIVEKTSIAGGENGEFVTVSGRSADMRSDLKEPVSEHFDEQTIGAIVSELAGRHGLGSKVDGAFAGVTLSYVARYEQSAVDFLTKLADRHGAIFAVKDRKFLFVRPGTLPAITIDKSECESWSFDVEPRPLYGRTQAGWFDRQAGEVRFEDHSMGLQGPLKRLRRIMPTQGEAKAAAKSEGDRLGRGTGSGSITLAGRPEILADAPIQTTGFRAEASGLWRCNGVDHVFAETYKTTVSVEAPEEGKS